MLLAINANNTNVKFGVIDGERIVGEWRQHTSAMRTADEHAVWLFQLMKMEGIETESITDAIIAITNIDFANTFAVCQFSFMDEMHTPRDYVKSIWALGLIEIGIYTLTGALIYAFVGSEV